MLFSIRRHQDKRPDKFIEGIKNFAPDYDEMLRTSSASEPKRDMPDSEAVSGMAEKIIALLQAEWPRRILDIGSGAGNIDMMILDLVPVSKIDCVEASPEMVRVSVSTLGRHLDRAEIIHKDVMDFNPEGSYEAIMSNLALHSMTMEEKAKLLGRIHGWLVPSGLFVWGDLIRQEKTEPHRETYAQRLGHAFRHSPGSAAAEENPGKETEDAQDHPLTMEETMKLCTEAGFSGAFAAWKRGSFAVFSMRK